MDMSLPEWLDQDSLELEVTQEETLLDVTEELYKALQQAGITKSELADKLGRTPAFISKLFRGSHNPTIKTLAEVAFALDKRVRVKLIDEADSAAWHVNDFDTSPVVVKAVDMYSLKAANSEYVTHIYAGEYQ